MASSPVAVAFTLTLLAGLATGIGSALALLARRTNTRFLSAALGFSAGVMVYVSFVEILADARAEPRRRARRSGQASWATVLAFFGGIGLTALIDRLVPAGREPPRGPPRRGDAPPARRAPHADGPLLRGRHRHPQLPGGHRHLRGRARQPARSGRASPPPWPSTTSPRGSRWRYRSSTRPGAAPGPSPGRSFPASPSPSARSSPGCSSPASPATRCKGVALRRGGRGDGVHLVRRAAAHRARVRGAPPRRLRASRRSVSRSSNEAGRPIAASPRSRCRSSTSATFSPSNADDHVAAQHTRGFGGRACSTESTFTPVLEARRWCGRGPAAPARSRPPMPSRARRTRPSRISAAATRWAVRSGIAKHTPWPGRMAAVLTPIDRAALVDERPARVAGVERGVGLDDVVHEAARPGRSERPSALTTPAVTVRGSRTGCRWRPRAGPRAARASRRARRDELRRVHPEQGEVGIRVVADERAGKVPPSASVTRSSDAPYHVAVREDEAVGREHQAGAAACRAACVRRGRRRGRARRGALDRRTTALE